MRKNKLFMVKAVTSLTIAATALSMTATMVLSANILPAYAGTVLIEDSYPEEDPQADENQGEDAQNGEDTRSGEDAQNGEDIQNDEDAQQGDDVQGGEENQPDENVQEGDQQDESSQDSTQEDETTQGDEDKQDDEDSQSIDIGYDDTNYVTSIEIAISCEGHSIYAGQTFQFTAKVTGVGNYDDSVTWSISGNNSSKTYIDSNGLLHVSSAETAEQITVIVTSCENTGLIATTRIAILSSGEEDYFQIAVPESTHKGMHFYIGYLTSYHLGEDYQYEDGYVVFSITSTVTSADTKITDGNCVNIGLDEKASSITVKAIAYDNSGKVLASDTAAVSFIHSGCTEAFDALDASCTGGGYNAGIRCSSCGVVISGGETIEPLGHELKKTAAKAATTTAEGNTAYWTCSRCGKYFSDSKGKTEIEKDSWIIPKIEVINIKSITFSETSTELGLLKSKELSYTVKPANANAKIVWTSSNKKIATVTDGVATAKARGTVTITAATEDGTVKASCKVTVLFNDILGLSSSFKKAINWVADKGIAGGYSDGSFGQTDACTRKQFAIMLYRYAGKPSVSNTTMPFSDCTSFSGDTYCAILWASQNGIVKGYADGTFRPNETVTRQQVMIMLYRFAGKPAVSGTMVFTDVTAKPGTDTYKAIIWGSTNGITGGTSATTFSPGSYCLRRQIAMFIYNYAN